MNRSKLNKLLTFLGDIFSEGKFKYPRDTEHETERRVEAWGEFIGEYDYKLVKSVVKDMVGEGRQWPPEVGEIKKEVEEKIKAREKRGAGDDVYVGQRKAMMEIEEQSIQETDKWLKEESKRLRKEGKFPSKEENNAGN